MISTLRFRYGNPDEVPAAAPAGSARLFLTPDLEFKLVDEAGNVHAVGSSGGGGAGEAGVVSVYATDNLNCIFAQNIYNGSQTDLAPDPGLVLPALEPGVYAFEARLMFANADVFSEATIYRPFYCPVSLKMDWKLGGNSVNPGWSSPRSVDPANAIVDIFPFSMQDGAFGGSEGGNIFASGVLMHFPNSQDENINGTIVGAGNYMNDIGGNSSLYAAQNHPIPVLSMGMISVEDGPQDFQLYWSAVDLAWNGVQRLKGSWMRLKRVADASKL
jgi:hypothetical protein